MPGLGKGKSNNSFIKVYYWLTFEFVVFLKFFSGRWITDHRECTVRPQFAYKFGERQTAEPHRKSISSS